MSEERLQRFALGHKKGDKLSKTYEKYKIFERIFRFFANDLLESQTNHSHRSRANEQISTPEKNSVYNFFYSEQKTGNNNFVYVLVSHA